MRTIDQLKIEKQYFPQLDGNDAGDGYCWCLSIPEIPGLCESGKTEKGAFEELMISLKVLLAYENNIEI